MGLLIIVVWSRAVVVEMGKKGDRLERDLRGKVSYKSLITDRA